VAQGEGDVHAGSTIHLYCALQFVVSRLEEKESDMKREYTKLHERYTEVSLLDWSYAIVLLLT